MLMKPTSVQIQVQIQIIIQVLSKSNYPSPPDSKLPILKKQFYDFYQKPIFNLSLGQVRLKASRVQTGLQFPNILLQNIRLRFFCKKIKTSFFPAKIANFPLFFVGSQQAANIVFLPLSSKLLCIFGALVFMGWVGSKRTYFFSIMG